MSKDNDFLFSEEKEGLFEFLSILLLSHQLRNEEIRCLGRPDLSRGDDTWDTDKKTMDYEFCANMVTVITYVNSVRVAFCDKHISILHNYFKEMPEKEIFLIDRKRVIDRYFSSSK